MKKYQKIFYVKIIYIIAIPAICTLNYLLYPRIPDKIEAVNAAILSPALIINNKDIYCLFKKFKSRNFFEGDICQQAGMPLSQFKNDKSKIRMLFIGDIHAQYDSFVELLKQAGYIDEQSNWIAQDRLLFQLGDVLDRGPQTEAQKCWDLLDKLQEQAEKAGGKVIRIVGDHELLYLRRYYKENAEKAEANGLYVKFGEKWRLKIQDAVRNRKIVAAYLVGKRIIVHAGVMPQLYQYESMENIEEVLVDRFNKLLLDAVELDNFEHSIFKMGKSRGGVQPYPGIFSADFTQDLKPIADKLILQMIAHTPDFLEHLICIVGKYSNIINIDVGMNKQYFGGGKDAWIVIEQEEDVNNKKNQKEGKEIVSMGQRLSSETQKGNQDSILRAI